MPRISILFIASIVVCTFVVSAFADERAGVVLLAAANNASQFTSIQFAGVVHHDEPLANGKGRGKFTDNVKYTYSNGMFRSETEFTDRTTDKRQRHMVLYDGKRYQYFQDKEGQLVISNDQPFGNIGIAGSALDIPYYFLQKTEPVTLAHIRNTTLWNEAAAKASFVGVAQLNGKECDLLEIPYLGTIYPGGNWSLHICSDYGHYPVKAVLSVGQETIGKIEADKFLSRTTDGTKMSIPTEIRFAQYSGGQLDSEMHIKLVVSSVKINEDFDPDLFSLPFSQAEWVHDVDRKTHLRTSGGLASSEQTASRWRAMGFVLLGIMLAACAAILVVPRLRGARK